jgi:hypothetical protein
MVTEELERDDVEDTLETVDGRGNDDSLVVSARILWANHVSHCAVPHVPIQRNEAHLINPVFNSRIIFTADDNWSTFAGGDLSERRLDLGVERVAGHDDYDRHVLVDESERTMLEFSSENTCGWCKRNEYRGVNGIMT